MTSKPVLPVLDSQELLSFACLTALIDGISRATRYRMKTASHIPKALFVGAAHLDRTGRLDAPAERNRSNPGRFDECVGGAALNVASLLQSFGIATTLLSICGNDAVGEQVAATMQTRSVAFHSQSSQSPTATYTAILQPDGGLVIAVADMGIYDAFDATSALPYISALSNHDWLILDANLPTDVLNDLVAAANCKCAALTGSAAKASRFAHTKDKFDLIMSNEAEIAALSGNDALPDCKIVVSRGAAPLTAIDNGHSLDIEIPARNTVQDVTGAGDALAAGTLAGLMLQASFEDSIRYGIEAAQKILDVDGPWRSDLLNLIGSPPKARI